MRKTCPATTLLAAQRNHAQSRIPRTRRWRMRLRRLLLLGVAFTAIRGPAQSIRFLRRHINIPGCELQMYLPAGADPEPLPPPQVYTYRIDAANGTHRIEERFDVHELWQREQRIGSWVDSNGNRLELAQVLRSAPPQPTEPPHIKRNAFDQWWENQLRLPFKDSDENLLQWVADYTGDPHARSRSITRPPMALRDLILYEWNDQPHQLALLFRLNPTAAGQAQATDTLFFVRLETHPGRAADTLRRETAERFLPSIAWTGGETVPMQADVTTAKDTPEPQTTPSADLMTGRRQIKDSLRNLPNWWHAETTHYLILTDIERQAQRLINRLTSDLDIMRRAYETLVPPPREITEVSVIRIFAEATDYARYVGDEYAWTGGLWKPSQREMVVRHPDRSQGRDSLESILRTVRHEAFHQYLFYAFNRIMPCAWFNEGHAVFFEYAQPHRNLAIEPHANHEDVMIGLARDERINIPRLLAMDYATFYDPDDTRRRENYALAWGLIYYLRLAQPQTDNPQAVTAIPNRYSEELWKLQAGPAATQAAWQYIDMDDFQRDLNRFWLAPMRRTRARRTRLFE